MITTVDELRVSRGALCFYCAAYARAASRYYWTPASRFVDAARRRQAGTGYGHEAAEPAGAPRVPTAETMTQALSVQRFATGETDADGEGQRDR